MLYFLNKFYVKKFFKDQDSSKFTGEIDKGGTGQRRICYL